MKPDYYSLPTLLKACVGIGDVSDFQLLGVMLHGMVVKFGFENHVVVASSVLDFYSRYGNLNDARLVFQGLLWKNSVAWNSMISGLAKGGLHLEALNCFKNMLGSKAKIDAMIVPTLLSVCGKLGDIK
ncbi:putative tetratricopeptide-like helical domain superfamily [Helianthus annuus]|nr:putative tetratricopeptide-like helical domain superfamily [Helianthus annuus]